MSSPIAHSLIRGFQFKSFTHWVKIYERIHGLGGAPPCRDRARHGTAWGYGRVA